MLTSSFVASYAANFWRVITHISLITTLIVLIKLIGYMQIFWVIESFVLIQFHVNFHRFLRYISLISVSKQFIQRENYHLFILPIVSGETYLDTAIFNYYTIKISLDAVGVFASYWELITVYIIRYKPLFRWYIEFQWDICAIYNNKSGAFICLYFSRKFE